MYLNVTNENNFEIPQLEGVPAKFVQLGILEESLPDLGFTFYNSCWKKQFLSDSFKLNVTIINVGLLFSITFELSGVNRRILYTPDEFGLLSDITAVEVLYIIYKWCIGNSCSNEIKGLEIGREYADKLKSIQNSIPPYPFIVVEKDILRFYINKLKKDINSDNDGLVLLTIINKVLNIRYKDILYIINAIDSNIIDKFTISIPTSEILYNFPKRLKEEKTSLLLTSKGLMGMKAEWDGPSLHDLELPRKYYEYLQNRIIRRGFPNWNY